MKNIVSLLLMLISSPAWSEKEPLWELGLGIATLDNPHYLGSDQRETVALPVPYMVYRGDFFRADRDGINSSIYASERLNIQLSGGGALPVNSEDNTAREGMDDLDWIAELGPTLQYQLFKNDKHLLRFDVPLHGAFTVGDSFFRHQGWTVNPRLHHSVDLGPWQLTSKLGPVFSDRRYHGYTYNIDQQDVRADRAFYQSNSGLTATRFSVSLKRRFNHYYVSLSAGYYDLHGAASEDSPLVKQDDYFSVALVFSRILAKSKTLVAKKTPSDDSQ